MKKQIHTLLFSVSLLAVSTLGNAANYFPQKVDYPVQDGPRGIAAGDFNGDGFSDLLVSHLAGNAILFLLNDGTGNFTPSPHQISLSPNDGPAGIEVNDYNKDGLLDFLEVNQKNGNVKVFIGKSDGSFQLANGSPVAVGVEPYYSFSADFNSDNKIDFLVANVGSDNASVFLGNGDGSFSPSSTPTIALGDGPVWSTGGDFDNDSKLDLVISNNNLGEISILLGNGDSTFTSSLFVDSGMHKPSGVVTSDFDHDSKKDIAIVNYSTNEIVFYKGNGDGSFTIDTNRTLKTGGGPSDLILADINSDLQLDLIVNNTLTDSLSVFEGKPDGSFQELSGSPFKVGKQPFQFVIGDFNRDGSEDIIITNYTSDNLTILFGNKAPALTAPTFADGELAITYTDNDNEKPDASTGGSIKVKIDGSAEIALEEADKSDTNVADGKIYKTQQTLNPGTHSIEVTANDGTYSTTLKDNISVSAGGGGGGCAMTSQTSPDARSFIFLALCLSLTFLITRLPQKRKELNP